MKPKKGIGIRDAWHLARPYWTSNEKWSAWGLLAATIALNLGIVYINVRFNEWNNAFYNALQKLDGNEFFHQLLIFTVLAAFYIITAVYAFYLTQLLQLRWRRWLTQRYLRTWLTDRAYYRLELASTTDNPDQRIAEDLNQFTS
ncbi:MAG TPA: SbmA/BacA-like family transporter, partial [Chthoniobacterales bacterium]|nr:SbmA/BacA-like family transporter [Chthoniobacterales bacterium]